jgi:hypothetical protein
VWVRLRRQQEERREEGREEGLSLLRFGNFFSHLFWFYRERLKGSAVCVLG